MESLDKKIDKIYKKVIKISFIFCIFIFVILTLINSYISETYQIIFATIFLTFLCMFGTFVFALIRSSAQNSSSLTSLKKQRRIIFWMILVSTTVGISYLLISYWPIWHVEMLKEHYELYDDIVSNDQKTISLLKAAQYGNQYESLAAFMSSLACFGLIITIWTQRSDLNLQHQQLKTTTNAFLAQIDIMKRQAFDSSFYPLWKQFLEVRSNFSIQKIREYDIPPNSSFLNQEEAKILSGSLAIEYLHHQIKEIIDVIKPPIDIPEIIRRKEILDKNNLETHFTILCNLIINIKNFNTFHTDNISNETIKYNTIISEGYYSMIRTTLTEHDELVFTYFLNRYNTQIIKEGKVIISDINLIKNKFSYFSSEDPDLRYSIETLLDIAPLTSKEAHSYLMEKFSRIKHK